MPFNTNSSGSDQPEECQPLDPSDEVRMTAQMRTVRYPGRGPIMNQYERRQRIGRGQHGEVHVGVDLNTGSWVAIKGMNRKNSKEDKMKMLKKNVIQPSPHTPITDRLGSTENKIRKEIAIMKKCRHAHIVRLLEVIDDRMKAKIYMIMEYLGGGEIKWRNTGGEPILHVDQARRICRDAILGLEYLHYQGIIHRDIKPANLLWTEDRQMVKISDFGVSHFSLALRAAAAGSGAALDDTSDPRLMDDSELTKMAGTPSFLAPEVVYEFTDQSTPSTSNSNNLLSTCKSITNERSNSTINVTASKPKPPITKAIDVWALGATLYCLLFGRIPFHHSGDNAYRLYIHIANSDWDVAETMGVDRIPTGGRHHLAEDTSEGAVVVRILDGMLQKDAQNRSTLDVVKASAWITRDIQNPAEWLLETSPSKNDMVMVTDSETASAMSSLKYRHGWPKRVKQRLSTLLHNVRAHRSSRSIGHREQSQFGMSSAPHLDSGHKRSRAKGRGTESGEKGKGVGHRETKEKGKGVDPREKGKGRSKGRPNTARNDSAPDITAVAARSKSIDRWSSSREAGSSLVVAGSSGRSYRGSEPLTPGDSDVDASSPTSSRAGDDHMYSRRSGDDRPRNRFSLASLKQWRPNKNTSHGSTPLATSTSTLSSSMEPYTPAPKSAAPSTDNQARSDVILGYFGDRNSPLIFARRASSWGEASDYFEDVLSLNSGDEFLEDDAIMLGAGGVSNEPPYGPMTPVGFATAASIDSLRPRQPQPERLFIRSTYDSAMHDTILSRQTQVRSQTTSPLAQLMYGSDMDIRNMPYDGGSDDDSLSYGDVVEDGQYQGGAYPDVDSINSGQVFEEDEDDEDDEDEDSDEEAVPIEVKRRRPSVAIAVAAPTPPLDSEP